MRTSKKREKFPWGINTIYAIPSDVRGVYGIWCRTNGKCIYVGKAEKQPIQARLKSHWQCSHNEKLRLWITVFGKYLEICYLPIDNEKKIDTMESRLIRAWRPEANIQKQRGK